MRRVMGLALALGAAAGCETQVVEREVLACTEDAQCGDGWRCESRRCVEDDPSLDGALPASDEGPTADRGPAPDAVVVPPDARPAPDAALDQGGPAEDAGTPDGGPTLDEGPAPDAMPPAPLCDAEAAEACCDAEGQVTEGAPCSVAVETACDGGGIAVSVACQPREIVRRQAGTCTAAGRCETADEAPTWAALRWCGAERMCGVDGECAPQRRVNANGQMITCLGAGWCEDRQEGHPCHMPESPNYPPQGICVRGACVDGTSDVAASTPSGPLSPLPSADPRPDDFIEVAGEPALRRDTRTGLVWRLEPISGLDSLRAADTACDELPPLAPESPDRWRVPDVYELASLLPAAPLADLLADGPLAEGPPLITRSAVNRANGAQAPVLVDFRAEESWLPEGDLQARTLCVYGARWTRGGDPRPLDLANGGLDPMTERNWGSSGRGGVREAAVSKDRAACGGLRSVLPPVGMAAALMRFDGGIRGLFGPPHAQACFWTASTTPDGGRWWIQPDQGRFGVARDEVKQCYVACTL